MALTTRRLTRDDFDQSMALSREAFGDLPPGATPPSPDELPAARLSRVRHLRWRPAGGAGGDPRVPLVVRRQRRPHRRDRRRRGNGRAAGREAPRRALPGGARTRPPGARRGGVDTLLHRPRDLPQVRLRAALLLRRGRGPLGNPGPDPSSGRRAHPPGHACRLRRGPRGLRHLGGRPERATDASRAVVPRRRECLHRRVHRGHARDRRGGRRRRFRELAARPGVRRLLERSRSPTCSH